MTFKARIQGAHTELHTITRSIFRHYVSSTLRYTRFYNAIKSQIDEEILSHRYSEHVAELHVFNYIQLLTEREITGKIKVSFEKT